MVNGLENTGLENTVTDRTVLGRTSFRFTADGRYVACLAQASDGSWHAECRPCRAFDSVRVEIPIRQGAPAQVLPRSDGGCWVCQPDESPDRHQIVLALPGSTEPDRSTALPPIEGLGGRLVPAYDDRLALAVTASADDAGRVGSVVYRLSTEGTVEPVLSVPGLLGGGVRLDADGQVAFTRAREGRLDTIVVDPERSTSAPLWPGGTGRRVLLAGSGLLVVAEDDRLGWCRYVSHADGTSTDNVRWPAILDDARALLPVAIDPDGRTIAFRVDAGARSELFRYVVDTGAVEQVELPIGVLGGTGVWTSAGLSVPLAEPGRPASVRTLFAPEPARAEPAVRTTAIRVVEFAGVQAVCYGDLDRAGRVVLALHGGPDAAWTAQPAPLLEALARSSGQAGDHDGDTAVVAVNPSGSRGRPGGRFGQTDVADVLAVARQLGDRLHGQPGRLGLVGSSYGGYLALRALCDEPAAFSRVCLLAPFWSAERLYAEAGLRVRLLLDRLGDLAPVPVERLGHVEAAPLLIGGGSDDVVPPSHLNALEAAFRQAGLEVRRIEVPDAGHDLLGGPGGDRVIGEVVRHLTGSPPRPPASGSPRNTAARTASRREVSKDDGTHDGHRGTGGAARDRIGRTR